jgi:ribonuclease VapC
MRVLAFDANQATMAFDAYLRFGRGSGHPAQLNLGDCAAYALAQSLNLPLLFKGNDFIHTDVNSAL